MQTLWKILQFILGFLLGMILFTGISLGIGYYFLSKLAQTPPKPLYAQTVSKPILPEQNKIEEIPVIELESTEQPSEEGYRARVTWAEGLSVRSEPNTDSERIGGVYYDQELIVLGESQEKNWQRIRVPDSDFEGWVKAGNLKRVE